MGEMMRGWRWRERPGGGSWVERPRGGRCGGKPGGGGSVGRPRGGGVDFEFIGKGEGIKKKKIFFLS